MANIPPLSELLGVGSGIADVPISSGQQFVKVSSITFRHLAVCQRFFLFLFCLSVCLVCPVVSFSAEHLLVFVYFSAGRGWVFKTGANC